jgi:hypothetical protein
MSFLQGWSRKFQSGVGLCSPLTRTRQLCVPQQLTTIVLTLRRELEPPRALLGVHSDAG